MKGNGKSIQNQQADYDLEIARLRSERDECYARMDKVIVRLEKVAESLERTLMAFGGDFRPKS